MVKKQYVKSRNVAKVTFEVPAEVSADEVQLIADFTQWRPVAFGRLKSGRWKLVQELEPGRSYQYRYRCSGRRSTTATRSAPTAWWERLGGRTPS